MSSPTNSDDSKATPAISTGTDRRRRKRAKIAAQVHVRGVNAPEPFEEVCKSIDVSRHGLLFTAARAGYWKGQRLEVTFPYSTAPAAFDSGQQAEIVRILERNGTYAIAVQFLNSKYNPATAVGTDRFGSATQFAPSASRASPQVIVLTVDSDVATSDLAHQTLSKDGYTVVSVSSARQALDFLRTAVPAVVIADIGGNDIPGQDLCVIIKRDERLQRVPVILLTRSDESADQAASQQLGAMACIAKPFNPGRLSQVVRLVAPPPGKRSVYGASRYFSSSIERAL